MAPRKIAAGNWKMNGMLADLEQIDALSQTARDADCDVLICPPAPLIHPALARQAVADGGIAIGAQDCHKGDKGAHTGDVSAWLLRDLGASAVILGHSERRADHCETSRDVAEKAAAAHEAGLCTIICVGESEQQRDAGEATEIIAGQVDRSIPAGASAANTVLAYEPIWAIGTGRIPTLDQIAEMHAMIRDRLSGLIADAEDVTLLYGGSVKPDNAAAIFSVPNVDGALVGGASLKAADFAPIITALSQSARDAA